MDNEKQPIDDGARARRKHRWLNVFRVLELPFTSVFLLAFVLGAWNGYLSWIGCIVGVLFTAPWIFSPFAGLAGKERLEAVLLWVHIGTYLLIGVIQAVMIVWPEGTGTWWPYKFDDVAAVLESKRTVPDANNAALRYRELFAAMDVHDRPNSVFTEYGHARTDLSNQRWTRQSHPDASEWLDAQAETINRLLAIEQMEDCRWPVDVNVSDGNTTTFEPFRRSSTMLAVAGNRDLGEGRIGDALTKYFSLMRMADHLYQQTQDMDFLGGHAIENMARRMLKQVLVEDELPTETVERIAEHLPSTTDSWHDDWSRLLQYEKLRYMNQLAGVYETNNEGAIRFATWSLKGREDRPKDAWKYKGIRLYWLMNMPLDPHGIKKMADKFFIRFEPRMELDYPLPPYKYHSLPSFTSFDTIGKLPCNFWRWAVETILFDDVTYEGFHYYHASRLTERRGMWLVLGLRKYKNEHGLWPESLDSVAQYVPADALVDPIAGEGFVYHREGESFRLYSKGPNRIDDGGRNQYIRESGVDEDDLSIWPPFVREPQPKRNRGESQQDSNDVSLAPSR